MASGARGVIYGGGRGLGSANLVQSPCALPHVVDFSIIDDEEFITHSVLTCKLDFSSERGCTRKLSVPSSLADMVQQSFIRMYHIVCSETPSAHCAGIAWQTHLQSVSQRMDEHFLAVESRIADLCAYKRTDEAWTAWAGAFESSILHACENVEGRRCRGHGQVRICSEPALICPKIAHDGSFELTGEKSLSGHIRKQYNRLSKLKQ